jgi:hypothetical protein
MPIVQRRAKRALDLVPATGTIGREEVGPTPPPRARDAVMINATCQPEGATAPGGASQGQSPAAGGAVPP